MWTNVTSQNIPLPVQEYILSRAYLPWSWDIYYLKLSFMQIVRKRTAPYSSFKMHTWFNSRIFLPTDITYILMFTVQCIFIVGQICDIVNVYKLTFLQYMQSIRKLDVFLIKTFCLQDASYFCFSGTTKGMLGQHIDSWSLACLFVVEDSSQETGVVNLLVIGYLHLSNGVI